MYGSLRTKKPLRYLIAQTMSNPIQKCILTSLEGSVSKRIQFLGDDVSGGAIN